MKFKKAIRSAGQYTVSCASSPTEFRRRKNKIYLFIFNLEPFYVHVGIRLIFLLLDLCTFPSLLPISSCPWLYYLHISTCSLLSIIRICRSRSTQVSQQSNKFILFPNCILLRGHAFSVRSAATDFFPYKYFNSVLFVGVNA